MSVEVVKAVEWRGMWATLPELHLVLDEPKPGPSQHSLMDRLVQSGTWYRSEAGVAYACDGDFYTSRVLCMDPKGPYSVRGHDGKEWRYSGFNWGHLGSLPEWGEMVQVSCCFKGSGNIQFGTFARSLVEAKIKEAGLEFGVLHGRVVYTGPKDRIRDADVYPNCNGITWGVHFYMRVYEGAAKTEDWGGAEWPDQATAKAVAAKFIKDGTKDICANLTTLKAKFPGHAAIAKVEAWEAKQRQKGY